MVDPSIRHLLAKPIRRGASPGLIAAIVDRRDVREIAAAGVRKMGHSERLLTTDSIHIGSNTKAMTSTMLAALVQDGVFTRGWNTTIGGVFPELLDHIHADYHRVTLWQLVTMTGGIKCNAADWHAHLDAPVMQRRYRILRDNLADPPAATAGEYFYSNLAYVVAGAMAEKVTGKTWETLMQARLFEPLGMSSAGFGPPGAPGQVGVAGPEAHPAHGVSEGAPLPARPGRLWGAWGHQRDPDGEDWVPNQLDNATALGPAGTVHVAIEDWAKFMALWLAEGPPALLDREALDRLITPVSGRYAAGWSVESRSWAQGLAITHAGSNTSWCAVAWLAPRIGHAFVAAANSTEPDASRTFRLLDRIVSKLIRSTRRRRRGRPSSGRTGLK